VRKAFYIKQTPAGRTFDAVNAAVIALLMFVMIYPFWNVVVYAFNDGADAVLGRLYFWPRKFSLANLEYVFRNRDLLRGAGVSVMRVLVGTTLGVACNALLGYIVSCRTFYGRRFMRLLFIVTMYFTGGLIPTYLLMLKLGLDNTFAVYILPNLFSCYYMLLTSSYIQGIPDSLFESARIDGAGELRTFWKIAVPLTVPMLACIAIFIGVNQWNSWFDVLLYSGNKRWDNLQIILYRLLAQATALAEIQNQQQLYSSMRTLQPQTVRAATTLVVVVPILFIYPFFQRYFVGGITLGAVKG
jgi:putative aldouronate transport system permease protein